VTVRRNFRDRAMPHMITAIPATARQAPDPGVRRLDKEDLRETVQAGIADFKASPP